MSTLRVLVLPGWQGSESDHWQMRWVRSLGYTVVEQHDWMHPLRGDWLIRLEEAVLDAPVPLVLVAHSLGCIQVAAWAAHSQNTARVKAALLVAPANVESQTLRETLHSWTPIARQRLPFKSILVGSENDPYCDGDTARQLALDWGSQWVNLGAAGHVNAESKLGDWLQGQALLNELLKD